PARCGNRCPDPLKPPGFGRILLAPATNADALLPRRTICDLFGVVDAQPGMFPPAGPDAHATCHLTNDDDDDAGTPGSGPPRPRKCTRQLWFRPDRDDRGRSR